MLSTLALICVTQLCAADLSVRGLGWFDNRAAGQKLKLLMGDKQEATLDANALEDAALVLISAQNELGYLEPALTIEATLPDTRVAQYRLDARLEPPLPRPLTTSSATIHFAKGRRFTLREVTFTGLLAMKEKEARALFIGENTMIPLASERIYSPGRLQRAVEISRKHCASWVMPKSK